MSKLVQVQNLIGPDVDAQLAYAKRKSAAAHAAVNAQTAAQNQASIKAPSSVSTPPKPPKAPKAPVAPVAPKVPSSMVSPALTQQPTFYRSGADIFNATTNQKIGATDWATNWTGRAKEVSAPTTPPAPSQTPQEPLGGAQVSPSSPTTIPNVPAALSPYEQARSEYFATPTVSPEETNIQNQLNALQAKQANITAGEQLGEVNVEGQPIAQPFITGQTAALQRMAGAQQAGLAAQQQPLLARLAQIQAATQAQKEIEKEKMAAFAPAAPSQVSAGGTLVDPATGKVIYTAPEKPISVSPGSSLIDPVTGKPLFSAPDKPITVAPGTQLVDPNTGKVISETPQKNLMVSRYGKVVNPNTGEVIMGSIQPGESGQTSSGKVTVDSNGQATGTIGSLAEAVLNGQLAMSQVRKGLGKGPTQYDQVQAEVLKRDPQFDFINNEASAKFRENVKNQQLQASAKNAIETAKIAKDLSKQIPRSKLTYVNGVIMAAKGALSDPTVAKFATTLNALGDEIGTVLGGGSATDYKAQLGAAMANPNLSQEAFVAAMDQIIILFNNRINAQLAQGGMATTETATSAAVSHGFTSADAKQLFDLGYTPAQVHQILISQ